MTWQPQPERGPEERPRGGKVAGVLMCAHHAVVCHGLVTAHGSVEGIARRVAMISAACLDCLREQREEP